MNGRSLAHLICWLRPAGVALALCGAGDVSTQVAAQDAELTDRTYDQRLLDGLRERGLFRLAAAHCRAELARSDLDERRRVELVIELFFRPSPVRSPARCQWIG